MSEHIKIETADGVMTLVLARPEKKNALTDAMYKALADALTAANHDPAVRAILIRAEGDLFTAGNDLGEFATRKAGDAKPGNVTRFLRALAHLAKPLVAAVQGRAVGVGTTMLLHCDQVVLAENAKLTTPFVGLALVPEAGSSRFLPARIGHVRAFSMFALGEEVDAEKALDWGLANRVVALDALDAAGRDIAVRLAKQPLGALMTTKRLMIDTGAITEQMDRETLEFSARLVSPEAREAFAAFAERRPPNFAQFT